MIIKYNHISRNSQKADSQYFHPDLFKKEINTFQVTILKIIL
jgi:hypothetical protein